MGPNHSLFAGRGNLNGRGRGGRGGPRFDPFGPSGFGGMPDNDEFPPPGPSSWGNF